MGKLKLKICALEKQFAMYSYVENTNFKRSYLGEVVVKHEEHYKNLGAH